MRTPCADLLLFLRRSDIPPGIEHQEDAFMSLAGSGMLRPAPPSSLPGLRLRLHAGRAWAFSAR